MGDFKKTSEPDMIGRRNFLKVGAAATAAATAAGAAGMLVAKEAGAAQKAAVLKGPILAGDASYAAKLAAGTGVPSNLPQRPGPAISIDTHAHWAPDVYLKAKADLGRPDFISPYNNNLVARAKWMDEHGEKMQVLTLGGFMPWQWVTPEQGVHIAQITNDASLEAHASMPDRFTFGLELPVGYAKGALAELNRVGGKKGLVAVHVPNSLAEREYLFEPEFAPVLQRIQDLGLPLLIHPLDGEPNWYGGKRLNDSASGNPAGQNATQSLFPGLTNSLGETYEQATTVCKLIVSGTLDKYPDLNIVICHGGGAFPYVVGRLDRGGGGGRLKYPVHSYIRRFWFDNLAWYPLSLKYLIDLVGSDRVVVGTDNMGAPDPSRGGGGGQNAAGGAGAGGRNGGEANGAASTATAAAGAAAAGRNRGAMAAAPGAGVPGPNSVLDQLDLTEADRDLILRGNLTKLYKLS